MAGERLSNKLLMTYLREYSHLKQNNSKEEHFFIMFLTLKATWGHFWEQCQVGGGDTNLANVTGQNGYGSTSVHETAPDSFTATAYSSVPSNGEKRVVLTKLTLLPDVNTFSHLCLELISLNFPLQPGAKAGKSSAFKLKLHHFQLLHLI